MSDRAVPAEMVEKAAKAVHDSWCADEDCPVSELDEPWLDSDLRNATAALSTVVPELLDEVERLREALRGSVETSRECRRWLCPAGRSWRKRLPPYSTYAVVFDASMEAERKALAALSQEAPHD